MRRRVLTAVMGVAMMGLATACPAETGPTIPPPVVVSAVIAPAPAVAGELLTIEIHATHAQGIFEGHVLLIARGGGILPSQHECTHAAALATPGTAGTVVLTCTLPVGMPNGPWSARVNITSNAGTTTFVDVPFTVSGGSDDNVGPSISALAALPTTTSAGAAFTFGLRLTDDHPPFAGVGIAYTTPAGGIVESPINCTPGAITPVDATSADVTFSCTVIPAPLLGTYRLQIFAADDFAQLGNLAFDVSVV